ncbi:unnamed protein product [Soboliphyme baturini]|uniref:GST_C_6 domain-containing protein n=1 Tax=Soboliphyme baturini TaxID=241478 RepID=A0A183IBR7_9BILA|nr:unnamed protein product [Soboliphyme baturini]
MEDWSNADDNFLRGEDEGLDSASWLDENAFASEFPELFGDILKPAEDHSGNGGSQSSDLTTMFEEFDAEIEEKARSCHVNQSCIKSILRHLFKNEHVLNVIRAIQFDGFEDFVIKCPRKMTRSKSKQNELSGNQVEKLFDDGASGEEQFDLADGWQILNPPLPEDDDNSPLSQSCPPPSSATVEIEEASLKEEQNSCICLQGGGSSRNMPNECGEEDAGDDDYMYRESDSELSKERTTLIQDLKQPLDRMLQPQPNPVEPDEKKKASNDECSCTLLGDDGDKLHFTAIELNQLQFQMRKKYLMHLKETHGSKSYFNVHNLVDAYNVVESAILHCPADRDPGTSDIITGVPQWLIPSFLFSGAFLYRKLLPTFWHSRISTGVRSRFFVSENNLFALGFTQFRCLKYSQRFKHVQQNYLPHRSEDQLQHHMQNMCAKKDNNVIRNCKLLDEEPVIQRDTESFDPLKAKPPCFWRQSCRPTWMRKFVNNRLLASSKLSASNNSQLSGVFEFNSGLKIPFKYSYGILKLSVPPNNISSSPTLVDPSTSFSRLTAEQLSCFNNSLSQGTAPKVLVHLVGKPAQISKPVASSVTVTPQSGVDANAVTVPPQRRRRRRKRMVEPIAEKVSSTSGHMIKRAKLDSAQAAFIRQPRHDQQVNVHSEVVDGSTVYPVTVALPQLRSDTSPVLQPVCDIPVNTLTVQSLPVTVLPMAPILLMPMVNVVVQPVVNMEIGAPRDTRLVPAVSDVSALQTASDLSAQPLPGLQPPPVLSSQSLTVPAPKPAPQPLPVLPTQLLSAPLALPLSVAADTAAASQPVSCLTTVSHTTVTVSDHCDVPMTSSLIDSCVHRSEKRVFETHSDLLQPLTLVVVKTGQNLAMPTVGVVARTSVTGCIVAVHPTKATSDLDPQCDSLGRSDEKMSLQLRKKRSRMERDSDAMKAMLSYSHQLELMVSEAITERYTKMLEEALFMHKSKWTQFVEVVHSLQPTDDIPPVRLVFHAFPHYVFIRCLLQVFVSLLNILNAEPKASPFLCDLLLLLFMNVQDVINVGLYVLHKNYRLALSYLVKFYVSVPDSCSSFTLFEERWRYMSAVRHRAIECSTIRAIKECHNCRDFHDALRFLSETEVPVWNEMRELLPGEEVSVNLENDYETLDVSVIPDGTEFYEDFSLMDIDRDHLGWESDTSDESADEILDAAGVCEDKNTKIVYLEPLCATSAEDVAVEVESSVEGSVTDQVVADANIEVNLKHDCEAKCVPSSSGETVNPAMNAACIRTKGFEIGAAEDSYPPWCDSLVSFGSDDSWSHDLLRQAVIDTFGTSRFAVDSNLDNDGGAVPGYDVPVDPQSLSEDNDGFGCAFPLPFTTTTGEWSWLRSLLAHLADTGSVLPALENFVKEFPDTSLSSVSAAIKLQLSADSHAHENGFLLINCLYVFYLYACSLAAMEIEVWPADMMLSSFDARSLQLLESTVEELDEGKADDMETDTLETYVQKNLYPVYVCLFPASIDAIVYGLLAPLFRVPFVHNPLRDHLKYCDNLTKFVDLISTAYLPITGADKRAHTLSVKYWNEVCLKAVNEMEEQKARSEQSSSEYRLRDKIGFFLTAAVLTLIFAVHFNLIKVLLCHQQTIHAAVPCLESTASSCPTVSRRFAVYVKSPQVFQGDEVIFFALELRPTLCCRM